MINKTIVIMFVMLLYCCGHTVFAIGAEANFSDHVLIASNWGNKNGEFGRESIGKTELGFSLEFTIYKNLIYIQDTMNNRIQVFDLNGKFVKKILLDFDWLKQGVAWDFAILRENFFVLLGYSFMNADIYIISPNGKILKEFGNKQLNRNKEEYFSKIIANEKIGSIFCSIGGSSKIAVYDFDGNFLKYLADVKSVPEIMLNADGQINKDAPHYCKWMDGKGNCYKIWSTSSGKADYVLTTKIQIFPPNSKTEDMITHEVPCVVKFVKEGKEHIIRGGGNFDERYFVTQSGTIYQLIALDDGVVLRRIEWKPRH